MVTYSVNEIKDECEKMLSAVEEADERVDLYYCKQALQTAVNNMTSEFSKEETYDESKVTELKQACEEQAVRLEYCLSLVNITYEKRYRERCFVTTLSQALKAKVQNLRRLSKYEELSSVLADYAVVRDIVEDAKHILFAMDDETYKLLLSIKEKRGLA